MFNALQSTAFTASVALLVPKEKLGQYGGLNQLAPALSMLIGPGLTGFLLQTIELEGIFLLEFVTFFIAVTITSVTTIPQPKRYELHGRVHQVLEWRAVHKVTSKRILLWHLYTSASDLH